MKSHSSGRNRPYAAAIAASVAMALASAARAADTAPATCSTEQLAGLFSVDAQGRDHELSCRWRGDLVFDGRGGGYFRGRVHCEDGQRFTVANLFQYQIDADCSGQAVTAGDALQYSLHWDGQGVSMATDGPAVTLSTRVPFQRALRRDDAAFAQRLSRHGGRYIVKGEVSFNEFVARMARAYTHSAVMQGWADFNLRHGW